MEKHIKIRVYPDGRIQSETVGINGKNCLKYIKTVEDMTGAKTTKSQFTNDYYKTEIEQNLQNEAQQKSGY